MIKEKKVIKIPLIVPIVIIIAIIAGAGIFGKELIMSAAKYISANAATTADGNFEYEVLEDGTVEITKYRGIDTSVTVPETVDGKSVTSIGNHAFAYNETIKEIVLPTQLNNIGYGAFSCCFVLKEIVIPSGVKNIGRSAFSYCNELTNIDILENVETIGDTAFLSCAKLETINVSVNNKKYSSIDGVLYNKEKTELICYPAGKKDTSYTILDGITKIEKEAFSQCKNLIEINIPLTVTNIETQAFESCYNLKEIKIPNGVKSIEDFTFAGCYNLTNIEIPEGVVTIGCGAFSNCDSLNNIQIPETVKSIERLVFEWCTNLQEINVSENNVEYSSNQGVLFNKDKTQIICYPVGKKDTIFSIPSTVTTIEESAFSYAVNLVNIEIQEGITNIGESAFKGCKNLNNIRIPEGVTSIELGTFGYCSNLKHVEMLGVSEIGYGAFRKCENLLNVDVSEKLTTIGENAFLGCENLRDIELPKTVTNIENNAFERTEIKKVILSSTKEIELPDIIKRAMDESDLLYSEEGFELKDCSLNANKTKLIMNTDATNSTLYVKSGSLYGLTIRLLQSGTITYSEANWYDDVIATLHIADGETIINNNGKNTYTFTENGQFTFEYTDINGSSKKATAKVDSFETEYSYAESIEVIAQPNKTKYNAHENFDSTGMKVKVKYIDGTQEETTNYTVVDGENLTCLVDKIEIQYNGDTYICAEIPIMVSHELQEATCTENAICKAKGCSYEEEALGHSFTKYVSNNNATCTEEGTKTAKCDRCDKTETITDAGSKKTHDYENGKCKVCGEKEPLIKITSEKYHIDDLYISEVQAETTIKSLKSKLETNATEIKIYKKGQEIEETTNIIVTGMQVQLKLNDEIITLTTIVEGDTNGDGKADFKDLVKINSHRLNKKFLSAEYLLAGDVNEDNKTDFKDLVKINKFRLNKITEL